MATFFSGLLRLKYLPVNSAPCIRTTVGIPKYRVLTLNLQEILYGFGLARTLHSKYTSSPSLMLDPLRLLPKLRTDWGISEKKKENFSFYRTEKILKLGDKNLCIIVSNEVQTYENGNSSHGFTTFDFPTLFCPNPEQTEVYLKKNSFYSKKKI